jgi:succinyl-CoA synthetase alpha subunit
MADRLALATRVRKARRSTVCPACRGVILPGMTIARMVSPPEWIHVGCVPAVARALAAAGAGPGA